MAKNDSPTSRVTAFADDDLNEAREEFYRPAASSAVRVKRQQEGSPERKGPRTPANRGGGDPELEEDSFLRARRRVPVRRGLIPPTRTGRILAGAAVVCIIGLLALLAVLIRNFFRDDPRFRIATSSSIQIMGNSQVTRPELLSVFGSDLGRNIFFIPLKERRAALEQLPWVEHATVMRLLPDQLRVSIVERTPVAFVRHGNTVGLVDAHGVLLRLPAAAMVARHYSFPVVNGISASDPLPVRAARMQAYQRFLHDLDAGDHKISPQLSEVDISDPEDMAALLPAEGSDVLVHFGDSDFLARYRSFQQHLPEWRQQYPHLSSVDMRYEDQVVLDMKPAPAAPAASATMEQKHAASPAHHAPVAAAKLSSKSAKAGRVAGRVNDR